MFEVFYRENLRLVYAIALASVTEPAQAEDISQETFIRAWRNYPQLRRLAPPAQRAWLLTTVRNLTTDFWRKQAMETNIKTEAQAPSAPQPELRLDVLSALSALVERDQVLVILRYLREMNSREIGELIGMPEGTVRRRLAHCRRILAQDLKQWAAAGVKR